MNRPIAVMLCLVLAGSLLRAQPASAAKVNVGAEVVPPRMLPGSSGRLLLTVSIAPGWHINAYGMTGEDVLPTEFGWAPPPGFTVTGTQYPRGEPVSVAFQKDPLFAYQDEVQIVVDFRVGDAVKPGTIRLTGDLTVQACSENVCLMPSELEVSVPVEILRPIRPQKRPPR